MIDLGILIVIAWGAAIGWGRGGFRSMLDCVGAGTAVAVALFSIPFMKDGLIDGFWAHDLRRWINDHLKAVPTSFGFDSVGTDVADRLYHLIVVGISSVAVFIGIQMILQVYITVWRQPVQSPVSRWAGALIGCCIGGMIGVYMVQCLGLLSWVKGLEILDLYLAKSFMRWVALNYLLN